MLTWEDKTIITVDEKFIWPELKKKVAKYVDECPIFQSAKGTSQNIGLYSPFLVLENIL